MTVTKLKIKNTAALFFYYLTISPVPR